MTNESSQWRMRKQNVLTDFHKPTQSWSNRTWSPKRKPSRKLKKWQRIMKIYRESSNNSMKGKSPMNKSKLKTCILWKKGLKKNTKMRLISSKNNTKGQSNSYLRNSKESSTQYKTVTNTASEQLTVLRWSTKRCSLSKRKIRTPSRLN
jgi:hypothetical protein